VTATGTPTHGAECTATPVAMATATVGASPTATPTVCAGFPYAAARSHIVYACPPPTPTPTRTPRPLFLRYLAINAGNVSLTCYESKLCDSTVVTSIRQYIDTWQPDIIMLSEALRSAQFTGPFPGGSVLPGGYAGLCDTSVNRYSGRRVAWNASNASHEHECIGWKTSRLGLMPGSALSAFGRNDAFGKRRCNYDFTGFRVQLLLKRKYVITAVAVHPNSGVDATSTACRVEEIGRYWRTLATGNRTIIGGDWNTEYLSELQVPRTFKVNYSFGRHWRLAIHPDEYSADYMLTNQNDLFPRWVFLPGKFKFDHTFSNFGPPCTNCGWFYKTVATRDQDLDLPFGSALGGADDGAGDNKEHPRADGGDGCDHRQVLVDMLVS